MPRLSFTLRDVFWLTLVVGIGVGWWIEYRARVEAVADAQQLAGFSESLAPYSNSIWVKTLQKKYRRKDGTLPAFDPFGEPGHE
jgi:hypothetical protein